MITSDYDATSSFLIRFGCLNFISFSVLSSSIVEDDAFTKSIDSRFVRSFVFLCDHFSFGLVFSAFKVLRLTLEIKFFIINNLVKRKSSLKQKFPFRFFSRRSLHWHNVVRWWNLDWNRVFVTFIGQKWRNGQWTCLFSMQTELRIIYSTESIDFSEKIIRFEFRSGVFVHCDDDETFLPFICFLFKLFGFRFRFLFSFNSLWYESLVRLFIDEHLLVVVEFF